MAQSMTTRIGDAATATRDALIVPVYAGEVAASGLDGAFGQQLTPMLDAAGFTGKRGDLLSVPTFGLLPTRSLVLTGLGERGKITGERLRRAYGAAIKRARDEGA